MKAFDPGFAEYAIALLGERVHCKLHETDHAAVATGILLSFADDGAFVLRDPDTGSITWCWPLLGLSPAKDDLMSCPCGRGDYGLCQDCPYSWCSVHGKAG